jgi:hypothetical protein
MMHDFNGYIRRRLKGIIEKSIKINELFVEEFDTIIKKTSIIIDFYNLQFTEDDPVLIVPIGTSEKPAGISRINDSFIIITTSDNKPLFYVHSEDLKSFIGKKFSSLKKHYSEDYELAVVLKYSDIADNSESKDKIFFNI